MTDAIVRIHDLTVSVASLGEARPIVKGISLDIRRGSITALVGGSGSGKTTLGLAILRLLAPALRIVKGRVIFKNTNILEYSPKEMRQLRGKDISMVFQDPLSAFNPVFRVGPQIEEVLRYHSDIPSEKQRAEVLATLARVGISDAVRVYESYPHELSGGMRQRAMIAQAVIARPQVLIADEPTSNLDVTLQAHSMQLFRQLNKDMGLSILLISHDLHMVGHLADDVVVMREGVIVEKGAAAVIVRSPQHPYTRELVSAFS